MYRKIRKGFTIVELVIVIAVIAVLTAVLVPTFVHLSKKAKAASDQSLVANLNTALKMEQGESGKVPKTMHDAVEGLKNQGYYLPQLVTKSGEELVYSIEKNEFSLSSNIDSSKKADYWHIQSDATNNGWSIYAYNWSGKTAGTSEHPLVTGFDVGNEEITSIYFGGGNNAVIRTNGGELVVNAPDDKVYHYGAADIVDIQAIASSSYHEKGQTTFAKIAQGRIVVEPGAGLGCIYVDSNNVILAQTPNAELPAILIDTDVNTFALQTTNNEGDKVTESIVTVTATDNITTAASSGSTAVPTEVSVKVERTPGDHKESIVITEEEAKEEAATVLPPVGVARIGAVGYATLDEALSVVQDGETLVLLSNFDRTSGLIFSGGVKTLDLNGYTLTALLSANKNAITVNAGCTFTLKDSSSNGTGKIIANRSAAGSVCALYVKGTANVHGGTLSGYSGTKIDGGVLNIYGGVFAGNSDNATITCTNSALNIYGGIINSSYRYAIMSDADDNQHTINISGGEINLNSQTAKAAIKLTNKTSVTLSENVSVVATRLFEFANTTETTQASILGGNYNLSVELTKGGDWSDNRDKATFNITGGTFNKEPSIAGFKTGSTIGTVNDNGNGTWTVTSAA